MAKKKEIQQNPWEHAKSLLFDLENVLTTYRSYVRKPPVNTTKLHCKHVGCPHFDSAGHEERLRDHEAEPHFECACGRYFTKTGLNRHLASLGRRGEPHINETAIDISLAQSLAELKKLIAENCPKEL